MLLSRYTRSCESKSYHHWPQYDPKLYNVAWGAHQQIKWCCGSVLGTVFFTFTITTCYDINMFWKNSCVRILKLCLLKSNYHSLQGCVDMYEKYFLRSLQCKSKILHRLKTANCLLYKDIAKFLLFLRNRVDNRCLKWSNTDQHNLIFHE